MPLFTFDNFAAFLTLTALEIVLGIDNIVFIAIVLGGLPPEVQDKTRRLGLVMAMLMRIALLFFLSLLMSSRTPLFTAFGLEISLRHLILFVGGLFLIGKATTEIHEKVSKVEDLTSTQKRNLTVKSAVIQIMIIDMIFSLDSVITAVGMVEHVSIMVLAIVASMFIMLAFSGSVTRFIHTYPTMKMLALSFLILIGMMLVAESFDQHIPRGYIYFAMAFSLVVELLNIKTRKKS